MKKSLLFLLLLSANFAFSQLTQHNVTVGGAARHYYKYLPANYQTTENLPVVFVLHGLGGNAQQMTGAGFNIIADTARIIVIYPDALMNQYNQTAWNNTTLLSSNADDVSFFNYLIDDMIINQNANSNRIYCTGFSMGSIMSYHLACSINDRIAAIGGMAGTMPTQDIQNCVPAYKTPVIHLHGTADGTVPYDSNPFPSLSLVPETIEFWRNVHGCNATPDSIGIANTANDGITVDRFKYNGCDPVNSLELWRLNNADHIYLYKPVNDITEAVEVWLFMRQFQHSAPAQAGLQSIEATNRFTVYPNPTDGIITVNSLQDDVISLYDLQGKCLQNITLSKGSNEIKLQIENDGIYILKNNNTKQFERIVFRK